METHVFAEIIKRLGPRRGWAFERWIYCGKRKFGNMLGKSLIGNRFIENGVPEKAVLIGKY